VHLSHCSVKCHLIIFTIGLCSLTGTSFFGPTAVGLVMVVVLAAVVVVVAVVTKVLAWTGRGALGV